jgi:hypothetical protein
MVEVLFVSTSCAGLTARPRAEQKIRRARYHAICFQQCGGALSRSWRHADLQGAVFDPEAGVFDEPQVTPYLVQLVGCGGYLGRENTAAPLLGLSQPEGDARQGAGVAGCVWRLLEGGEDDGRII